MKEYAFDAKLWAVVRVMANSEKEARQKMINALDSLDIGYDKDGVKVTEASIEDGGDASALIEVDGEAV